jgi:Ca2+-transporting ATPase
MAGVSVLAEALALRMGSANAPTMVFTVLSLSQMAQILAVRSERRSLLDQGFGSNRPLLGAVLLTIGLQILAVYAPPLNRLLDTAPLSARELGLCLALATVVFWAVELEKAVRRRQSRCGSAIRG